MNKNDLEFSAISYLLGKTCEMIILHALRPEFGRVWIAPEEIEESIVFNLPEHLLLAVLDMVDGCENAFDKYMKEKENIDLKQEMLDIQYIAEMLCDKHKLYDIQVEGYNNKQIAFPSELYTYANNVLLQEFQKDGYKVEAYANNFNSPCSFILEKDNEKMFVLENITIQPKKGKFQEYLRKQLYELSFKEHGTPYVLGVMLQSNDTKAAALGVVPKSGSCSIRRTDFIKA